VKKGKAKTKRALEAGDEEVAPAKAKKAKATAKGTYWKHPTERTVYTSNGVPVHGGMF
jgi:hypothetical protein